MLTFDVFFNDVSFVKAVEQTFGGELKRHYFYIDGLVQDCSNSIINALELLQSCTKHRYDVNLMYLCSHSISCVVISAVKD